MCSSLLPPPSTVTYVIVATNNGPDAVTGASVSDTFPDSLTAAVLGIGSLFGVQPINGGTGTGADPNKLNYAGNAAILLTVNPTTLNSITASQLTAVGGGTNGLSPAVNAIKCLGLQAAISDATCTAAQSALAGITT